MSVATFAPDATTEGYLPPWEVAKAYAFHVVLQKAAGILFTVAERVQFFQCPESRVFEGTQLGNALYSRLPNAGTLQFRRVPVLGL